MKLTYSIQVCNESRELFSLLNILTRLIDTEDYIDVVVDSANTTEKVSLVLEHFKDRITVYERPFDTFSKNCQFHIEVAKGDYVFHIASPYFIKVPKNENDMLRPAIEGTIRALSFAQKAGIKRVVLTSSIVAMIGEDSQKK